MQKGKLFFNIIIAITTIALISAIGYAAYYYLSRFKALKDAETAANEFENNVIVVALDDFEKKVLEENVEQPNTAVEEPPQEPSEPKVRTSSNTNNTTTYRGYSVLGTIQIPKTKVKSVIVDKVTPNSISAAVGVLYGPGLNEIGNTVLAAHNYRNRNILFKQ